MNVDPASDNYQEWTLYHYAKDNPVIFVDPSGMFTELYNENGKKIGEDSNGDDGNVSIITDKDDARRIAREYKDGGVATEADVNSGIKTTKVVLTEALNVLTRTEANGGAREETSVVTGSGEVVRGETGAEPTYETIGGTAVQTAEGRRPDLPAGTKSSEATLIHSHPTAIVEHEGQFFPQSANSPSTTDRVTFMSYGTNIIVGKLGRLSTIEKGTNGVIKDTRSSGAVFYNNRTSQKLQLTRNAMQRIIK